MIVRCPRLNCCRRSSLTDVGESGLGCVNRNRWQLGLGTGVTRWSQILCQIEVIAILVRERIGELIARLGHLAKPDDSFLAWHGVPFAAQRPIPVRIRC
jgi:hypothetical protein